MFILAPFVSILILMDLPFLFSKSLIKLAMSYSFNPYSNGSSFFIIAWLSKGWGCRGVSILILMDLPFLLEANVGKVNEALAFQSLF